MYIYKFLIQLILLLSVAHVSAQVGIQTDNPQGVFHVDGAADNSLEGLPTADQSANDLIIDEQGQVGIGNLEPKVKLDLRADGNSDNNTIGIDFTSMSASEAGAGAIRYVDLSGGRIEVSNGVTWRALISSPVKASVVARINSAAGTRVFSYATAKVVDGWEVLNDPTYSFDSSSGTFVAPREGIYTLTFSYDFVIGNTLANSSVETLIVKNNSEVLIKCMKSYGKSTRPAQAGGSCNGSFELNEGDAINVQLNQKIDSNNRALRTHHIANPPYNHPDFGFNNLTIVEK